PPCRGRACTATSSATRPARESVPRFLATWCFAPLLDGAGGVGAVLAGLADQPEPGAVACGVHSGVGQGGDELLVQHGVRVQGARDDDAVRREPAAGAAVGVKSTPSGPILLTGARTWTATPR